MKCQLLGCKNQATIFPDCLCKECYEKQKIFIRKYEESLPSDFLIYINQFVKNGLFKWWEKDTITANKFKKVRMEEWTMEKETKRIIKVGAASVLISCFILFLLFGGSIMQKSSCFHIGFCMIVFGGMGVGYYVCNSYINKWGDEDEN